MRLPHGPIVLLALLGCRNSDDGFVTYNSPPGVSITSPTPDASFYEAAPIGFNGIISDDGGVAELYVSWRSDLDGLLEEASLVDASGNVTYTTSNLSPGNHVITLTAIDLEAEAGDDYVNIVVIDQPDEPSIYIVHPVPGESAVEDEEYEFVAKVVDAQDAYEDLEITIESDLDGVICIDNADATGALKCERGLAAGDHMLTFLVRDPEGFTAQSQVVFPVISLLEVDNDGDGFSESQGDCDDDDKHVNPVATEFLNGRDDDCDGSIDNDTEGYDDDGDGQSELKGDCDDTDPAVYEDATEIVDGKDNDCNGKIDDGTEVYDDDGDTYAEIHGDCDDEDKRVNPGATEVFNGVDDDCDGIVDDNTFGYDDDKDGYTELMGDCDDYDSTVRPGAKEVLDGKDNDCNGKVDDGTDSSDDDGDGYSEAKGDCNDGDKDIFPGNTEVPDGKDNDCNGKIDDKTNAYDDDGDGFTENAGDCDDTDKRVRPGAPEIQDGVDNNCNGVIDEGGTNFDDDGDGFSEDDGDCDDTNALIKPGAAEICDNGKDDNCAGGQNEEGASGCVTYYKDADNDGFGAAGTGRCLCSGGDGQWDVKDSSDCYDSNANVYPGQIGFFATHRGDGKFDYNCDGQELKKWGTRASCAWVPFDCVASPEGWRDGAPNCGASGTWTNDCDACWSACCAGSNGSKTQECK